jgi:hypothetical protein
MESEPDGPYCGGDDEVSRQREKRATDLLARLVPRTDEAADSITGTGTVVEFPLRRRSYAHGSTFGSAPTDPAHGAPHGMLREPAAVTTDGAASDDVGRLLSVVVGATGTEEQVLNSARRLQLLQRLQAMLLPN